MALALGVAVALDVASALAAASAPDVALALGVALALAVALAERFFWLCFGARFSAIPLARTILGSSSCFCSSTWS